MQKITHIFKMSGGDRKYFVRIGDIDIVVPEYSKNYPIPSNVNKASFEEVTGFMENLNRPFTFSLGQEIHDNKLEVLKSEFDWGPVGQL